MINVLIEHISREMAREQDQWLKDVIRWAIKQEDLKMYEACLRNIHDKVWQNTFLELIENCKIKIIKADVKTETRGMFNWQYIILKEGELYATKFFKY